MSTELLGPPLTQRDVFNGVDVMREFMAADAEQRQGMVDGAAQYLGACSVDELVEVAGKVEGLYGRSSTVQGGFGAAEVDAFATPLNLLLMVNGKQAVVDRLKDTRKRVMPPQRNREVKEAKLF